MTGEQYEIQTDRDLNELREQLRNHAQQLEFSGYEVTKLITASSEIARNMLEYTSGGEAHLEIDESGDQRTIAVEFVDEGPGIEDVDRAMEDGFRGETSNGLGVGLPGARRLSDEFEIESDPERGTTVTLVITSTN